VEPVAWDIAVPNNEEILLTSNVSVMTVLIAWTLWSEKVRNKP